ncbi:MAG: class I SAM-dependent methyltransferase [Nitrospirae bacterium]|nr:MAG: class I SAM-dependent methyltransferase [Nitrospirota bacterium]
MSYYRQQLEEWLAGLNVKAHTVYDIGGAQGHVRERVKRWQVINYKVLDLPEYDLSGYDWWIDEHEELKDSADLIFCLEVFEYLIDPVRAMENLEFVMKPGGRAYVTFQFVYPHHNELEMDSLRYTEFGIKRLAEKVGLKINNIWYRRDRSGLLESFYKMDGMRAAKQYPHHDTTGFIVEFER